MATTNPPDRWLPIDGYQGFYEVSDLGRVRSVQRLTEIPGHARKRTPDGHLQSYTRFHPEKIIRPNVNNGYGHMSIRLHRDGKYRSVGLHRLVLEAFVGPCPLGMQGCHNDGDPANNALENLRWDTPKANQADSHRQGKAYYARYKPPTVMAAAKRTVGQLELEGKPELAYAFSLLVEHMKPHER